MKLSKGRILQIVAIMVLLALFFAGCEMYDPVDSDTENETEADELDIDYGTIPGSWSAIGDPINLVPYNVSGSITAQHLIAVDDDGNDTQIHGAMITSPFPSGSTTRAYAPQVRLFSWELISGSVNEWYAWPNEIDEGDTGTGGAGFGNVLMTTFGNDVSLVYDRWENAVSDNEPKAKTLSGASITDDGLPNLSTLELARTSGFAVTAEGNRRYIGIADTESVKIILSEPGETDVVIDGPDNFVTGNTSSRDSSSKIRNWDIAVSGGTLYLVYEREIDQTRSLVTASYDGTNWTVIRILDTRYQVLNVRATARAAGGIYTAVINGWLSAGLREGLLFTVTQSPINSSNPDFMRKQGSGTYATTGLMLELFTTSNDEPVVFWNEARPKAAALKSGSWDVYGGDFAVQSNITSDGAYASAAFHNDVPYLLIFGQLWKFD